MRQGRLKVRYTAYNGDWFIENKSSDVGNVKADSTLRHEAGECLPHYGGHLKSP